MMWMPSEFGNITLVLRKLSERGKISAMIQLAILWQITTDRQTDVRMEWCHAGKRWWFL